MSPALAVSASDRQPDRNPNPVLGEAGSLIVAAILILGIMSVWFANPARLASMFGLTGAGPALAASGDEINLPVKYGDDAEKIGDKEVARRAEQFGIHVGDADPRVYWRMTDNRIELTSVSCLSDHGGRGIKDAIVREILHELYRAKIEVASGAYAIVELPPIG